MEEVERSSLPASIPSIASLTRKSSKTPAQDIVDILTVKGKLEASENTIESLAELVDSLVTDVNIIKEASPAFINIPIIEKNMQEINENLDELQRTFDDQLKSQSKDAENQKKAGKLVAMLKLISLKCVEYILPYLGFKYRAGSRPPDLCFLSLSIHCKHFSFPELNPLFRSVRP